MDDKSQTENPDDHSKDLNANSAHSGTGKPARLSDYPDGNLNQDDDKPSKPEGKSISEATDPSKLSDI